MTTERRDEELSERWSAQRKTEIVLRVIRGDAIDEVAREIQVPVHAIPLSLGERGGDAGSQLVEQLLEGCGAGYGDGGPPWASRHHGRFARSFDESERRTEFAL